MNALVIVDMQNDFVTGLLGTPEARRIVPQVAERLRKARENGDAVIFTRDTHGEDYLQTREGQLLPILHTQRGTLGWALIPELDATDAPIIDKSAFGSLELAQLLCRLQPDEITLCGVCTDFCVLSNAMVIQATLPNTPITVDAACCAGSTPENHRTALSAMSGCHIRVLHASAGQADG